MAKQTLAEGQSAAGWFYVYQQAVRVGNQREAQEARAALARLGVTVIIEPDSPLRSGARVSVTTAGPEVES